MNQLATEDKLGDNNLELLWRVSKCLQTIRQETEGFGTIRCDVQNGMVVNVVAELRYHLKNKSA